MSHRLCRVAAFVCCVTSLMITPSLAYVDQIGMPLSGHGMYSAGKGSATYTEGFGLDQDRGAVLLIEVKNVPLPPGTELDVLVDDKELGVLVLDRQRGGTFRLDSRVTKRAVPRLQTGSRVVLKLSGGPVVLW